MISIIIPTLNEEKNIKKIIDEINSKVKIKHEIIVVDDDSKDKTREIAKKQKNTIVFNRTKDKGLSQSVIFGFKKSKFNKLVVIDADLSHPPVIINALYEQSKKTNIVVASRNIKGGGVENWPFHRKFMSRFASILARPLTKCSDPMSGFFLIDKKVLPKNLKAIGYKILLELLVKTKSSISEVPYIFRNRKFGESKIGSKVIFDYLKHLLKLYKYKIFK